MNAMADKKKQTSSRPEKPLEPQKPQKPKRKGKPLHVWIQGTLRDALDRACEQNKRKVNKEVEVALERYLRDIGLWPPPNPGIECPKE